MHPQGIREIQIILRKSLTWKRRRVLIREHGLCRKRLDHLLCAALPRTRLGTTLLVSRVGGIEVFAFGKPLVSVEEFHDAGRAAIAEQYPTTKAFARTSKFSYSTIRGWFAHGKEPRFTDSHGLLFELDSFFFFRNFRN